MINGNSIMVALGAIGHCRGEGFEQLQDERPGSTPWDQPLDTVLFFIFFYFLFLFIYFTWKNSK